MSNEMNVSLWTTGTLGPGQSEWWIQTFDATQYNALLRRVRVFEAVPYIPFPDSGHALPLPPDPPYPSFDQAVEVTQVFYILAGATPVPLGSFPPDSGRLTINVIVTNKSPDFPVTYQVHIGETDN